MNKGLKLQHTASFGGVLLLFPICSAGSRTLQTVKALDVHSHPGHQESTKFTLWPSSRARELLAPPTAFLNTFVPAWCQLWRLDPRKVPNLSQVEESFT